MAIRHYNGGANAKQKEKEKKKSKDIMSGPPPNSRRTDNDDLLLFKELQLKHKRDKEKFATSLLDDNSISDDFVLLDTHNINSNANHHGSNFVGRHPLLYRISSSGKKAHELLSENEKDDYNWLKTPPATPLFPSLEMEANAPQLVLQRELPILMPYQPSVPASRFASAKGTGRPKSPPNSSSKPKIPLRSKTPFTQRPNTTSTTTTNNNNNSNINNINSKNNNNQATTTNTTPLKATSVTTTKPPNQSYFSNTTSNNNSTAGRAADPKGKLSRQTGLAPPTSRRASAVDLPITGFSNETPANLRTTSNRTTSVVRNRQIHNMSTATSSTSSNHESLPHSVEPFSTTRSTTSNRSRRESTSPSVTRGRKEVKETPKTVQTNGTQIFGSKMVDRVINARKSIDDPMKKQQQVDTVGFGFGIGRMIISKSSMDHIELKRDRRTKSSSYN